MHAYRAHPPWHGGPKPKKRGGYRRVELDPIYAIETGYQPVIQVHASEAEDFCESVALYKRALGKMAWLFPDEPVQWHADVLHLFLDGWTLTDAVLDQETNFNRRGVERRPRNHPARRVDATS